MVDDFFQQVSIKHLLRARPRGTLEGVHGLHTIQLQTHADHSSLVHAEKGGQGRKGTEGQEYSLGLKSFRVTWANTTPGNPPDTQARLIWILCGILSVGCLSARTRTLPKQARLWGPGGLPRVPPTPSGSLSDA